MGSGGGARGSEFVGAGSALGAALEISGLRGRGGADGIGSLLRKICGAIAGERSGERVTGGARVELCACEREIDAADYAGEGSGSTVCGAGSIAEAASG